MLLKYRETAAGCGRGLDRAPCSSVPFRVAQRQSLTVRFRRAAVRLYQLRFCPAANSADGHRSGQFDCRPGIAAPAADPEKIRKLLWRDPADLCRLCQKPGAVLMICPHPSRSESWSESRVVARTTHEAASHTTNTASRSTTQAAIVRQLSHSTSGDERPAACRGG
eukprot:COSAG01_NODE_875_length_12972_cov_61.925503_5_plen_166_part_00